MAPYLIKNDDQNVTLTEFDVSPSPPFFFGNTGYVQVNSDIYKSLDLGNSWSKIKTFENRTPELYFISAQEGFAFVNNFPNEIYITKNGGLTWVKYYEYDGSPYREFNLKRGLIGGENGQLWKYIKE